MGESEDVLRRSRPAEARSELYSEDGFLVVRLKELVAGLSAEDGE
jgi:hypothetical protein